MALAVPPGSGAGGNLTFVLIMIGLTLGTVAVSVYHPIAWSDEEVRIAVGGPPMLGILLFLGAVALGKAGASITVGPVLITPLSAGFALVVAGLVIYAALRVAGRLGFGPMALEPGPGELREVPPSSPPAEGWLRLGSGWGLSIVWMLISLIAIPVVVYVVSYLPWAAINGNQIVPGWPPGHAGQTLLQLTEQMYAYHNNLTAAHPRPARHGGRGRSISSRSGSTRAGSQGRPRARSTTPATSSSGGWASRPWRSSPTRASVVRASRSGWS